MNDQRSGRQLLDRDGQTPCRLAQTLNFMPIYCHEHLYAAIFYFAVGNPRACRTQPNFPG